MNYSTTYVELTNYADACERAFNIPSIIPIVIKPRTTTMIAAKVDDALHKTNNPITPTRAMAQGLPANLVRRGHL